MTAQNNRETIALNGTWDIEESIDSLAIPNNFTHQVQVPGMVNQSIPAFPKVDEFTTSDIRFNLKIIDEPTVFIDSGGVSNQPRNFFWYKKEFELEQKKEHVFLEVKKAQFGSAVWVNDTKVGENLSCFTSMTYDITKHVKWQAKNTVIIRIGAHPNALPKEIPYGIDYEKYKWTPGIYDDVSLILSNNPVIEKVQIAPNIHNSTIVVQYQIHNYNKNTHITPEYEVIEWKTGKSVTTIKGNKFTAKKDQVIKGTDMIAIPNAKLWDLESPFLYTLKVRTSGDEFTDRFGMREFRFDTATRRAYLNDTLIFLRGSNITLHRFFEDPDCGNLPWNDYWIRRLLGEVPKSMHWNSFRFCIGSVPDRWFEIADEEGILIQNEFFIWTLSGIRNDIPEYWSMTELKRQLKDWMSDSWNHPSLVIWDAMNETKSDKIRESKLIEEIRKADLSNRPWDVSYNPPTGANDMTEFHPYQIPTGFYHFFKGEPFDIATFETSYPLPKNSEFRQTGQSMMVNEYGWLWLNRDGTPTVLTKRIYDHYLGKENTIENRRALYAYVVAGHTEFLRAFRTFAGVQHFVYLTSSHSKAITSDNFIDLKGLELEPNFIDYVGEAFKPIGVYLHFWQPTLERKEQKRFTIMLVNDTQKATNGQLELSIENENGEQIEKTSTPFDLIALGQQTLWLDITIPDLQGNYLIKAKAIYGNGKTTQSRRKVVVK
jgi:hypothetical protein